MRLFVDANILFSALIKDSLTAKILVDDRLSLINAENNIFASTNNLILFRPYIV
jgi:hypothetical protein